MDSTNRLRTRVPAKASRKTSNGPPYPDTPADGRLHCHTSHTLATRNTKPPRNNHCAWRSDTSRCSLLPTLHGHSSHLRNDSVYPVGITFQQADETQSRCHSCKSDGQSSLPLGPTEDWASVPKHNDPRTAILDLSPRATQRREENRRHSSSDIILAKAKFSEYLLLLDVTPDQTPSFLNNPKTIFRTRVIVYHVLRAYQWHFILASIWSFTAIVQ